MGKEVGATTTREGSLNSKMARGESQGEDRACFLTLSPSFRRRRPSGATGGGRARLERDGPEKVDIAVLAVRTSGGGP